jgi:hypothetical protein
LYFDYSASTLIDCPITIKQLIEWINNKSLPYYDIKKELPSWMRATGRDRFNLEKMTIHSGNLFYYYHDFIQPVIKPYISRCLIQSSSYFYEILIHFCEVYCRQIYFPFDNYTRIYFDSICQRILQTKSTGRRFLSTSFHIELSALAIIITIILLRSINDHLLDEFIQNISKEKYFSYSLWLRNLNELISLQSNRNYQFHGRNSILLDSITDNHSKLRYMKSLSKIFEHNVHLINENIYQREQHIRQILIENCKPGSLIYAIKPQEFFSEQFNDISSSKF